MERTECARARLEASHRRQRLTFDGRTQPSIHDTAAHARTTTALCVAVSGPKRAAPVLAPGTEDASTTSTQQPRYQQLYQHGTGKLRARRPSACPSSTASTCTPSMDEQYARIYASKPSRIRPGDDASKSEPPKRAREHGRPSQGQDASDPSRQASSPLCGQVRSQSARACNTGARPERQSTKPSPARPQSAKVSPVRSPSAGGRTSTARPARPPSQSSPSRPQSTTHAPLRSKSAGACKSAGRPIVGQPSSKLSPACHQTKPPTPQLSVPDGEMQQEAAMLPQTVDSTLEKGSNAPLSLVTAIVGPRKGWRRQTARLRRPRRLDRLLLRHGLSIS